MEVDEPRALQANLLSRPFFTIICIFFALAAMPVEVSAQSGPRAFLGVRMDSVTAGRVRITSVLPGSAAATAGIQSGDFLIRVAGRAVSTSSDVVAAVGSAGPGAHFSVVLERSGNERRLDVVLRTAPPDDQLLRSFVGRPAPTWQMLRANGTGTVDLTNLRAGVVVAYFWSIWCGACRLATPDMIRLERSLTGQGLSIVAIADNPLRELQSSAAASAIPFPVLHDLESKTGNDYWISAVPTFFIIDRAGNVTFASAGWDAAQGRAMEAEIRRLLARPAP